MVVYKTANKNYFGKTLIYYLQKKEDTKQYTTRGENTRKQSILK